MDRQADFDVRGTKADPRRPIWRRVTALFSLGSIVALIGVIVATVIGASALLALFVLDRAIAG